MSLKLKLTKDVPRISTDLEDLEPKDKLSLIKADYKLAVKHCPDYAAEKLELRGYFVEAPAAPSLNDISDINKLYAMTQSFSSRVTSIEVNAIDNYSRWKRLVNLIEGYIEDKEYKLMAREDIAEMSNMKAEAACRVILSKQRSTMRKFKSNMEEAYTFMLMVERKKKDLSSVLVTLGKQVKALSLERELDRN
jgi:hypothetical protein